MRAYKNLSPWYCGAREGGRADGMKGQLHVKQKGGCAFESWQGVWAQAWFIPQNYQDHPCARVPQRFDLYAWLLCVYSFIPWLNVQRRVAKEFLPGSWAARQVGTSFSLPTWRSCLVMAHGASELEGLPIPSVLNSVIISLVAFLGLVPGLFWFSIIFEVVEELK